jgi:hypothetical protein
MFEYRIRSQSDRLLGGFDEVITGVLSPSLALRLVLRASRFPVKQRVDSRRAVT